MLTESVHNSTDNYLLSILHRIRDDLRHMIDRSAPLSTDTGPAAQYIISSFVAHLFSSVSYLYTSLISSLFLLTMYKYVSLKGVTNSVT